MDGTTLHLIHQPSLPHEFRVVNTHTFLETAEAIKTMVVRGAGAIGAAGAAGMAQAIADVVTKNGSWAEVEGAAVILRKTRPTAQNLFYGIDRVLAAAKSDWGNPSAAQTALSAAQAVADEDVAACEAIGQAGMSLIEENTYVLTHCNAGWLAFVDWGSALAPMYAAKRAGRAFHVLVPETQPLGQGSRLTAWELAGEGIPHTILADSAVGLLCSKNQINCMIVGADRIAANGDVVNKIGTYTLAVLASVHEIPFYVAAPTTTIDLSCATGLDIPLEERDGSEVLSVTGQHPKHGQVTLQTAPKGSTAFNPAFDVTPAGFVTGFITETGILSADEIRLVSS